MKTYFGQEHARYIDIQEILLNGSSEEKVIAKCFKTEKTTKSEYY
jgi:hypothetical protein